MVYELALDTHLGIMVLVCTANATVLLIVISEADSTTASQTFALEGLGNSQNLIVAFYEDGPYWQIRLAFNNREGFLQDQVDSRYGGYRTTITLKLLVSGISVRSYDINETFTQCSLKA